MDYRISKMIEEETGCICIVLVTKRGVNVYDVVVIPMSQPGFNPISFKFYDSSANKDKYLHESIFESIMKEMDKQISLT